MKKLLFITHEATRTGAPFVVLFFLQWLQQQRPEIETTVLTLKDGDLEDEFKKASTYYYSLANCTKEPNKSIVVKVLNKLGVLKTINPKKKFIKNLAGKQYDFVYANTILAMPIGNEICQQSVNTKHIVHIHELEAIIKLLLPKFKSYTNNVQHFIAASNLVKQNLINSWNIPASKITRVYECSRIKTTTLPQSLKEKTFHVGGSGTVHWRKGSDVFVQVASYVKNHYPEHTIKFTWVGGISTKERIIIEEDLRKLGLENVVSFVGKQVEPQVYYNAFDVFLMTSREDPFPLVCIELGMLGKPIICFDGATGSQEIIQKGGGTVVPYLSVRAMAEQIITYKEQPNLIKEQGQTNKHEFSKFTPEIICPELYKVITSC